MIPIPRGHSNEHRIRDLVAADDDGCESDVAEVVGCRFSLLTGSGAAAILCPFAIRQEAESADAGRTGG
jgi:hypothetical protein